MKYLKIIIPISILSLVFIIDYYNKYYKPNTSFEAESIFLYVMKDDSIAFRDSISKYIKSEKTFYKVAWNREEGRNQEEIKLVQSFLKDSIKAGFKIKI